jgi:hypothetical protein
VPGRTRVESPIELTFPWSACQLPLIGFAAYLIWQNYRSDYQEALTETRNTALALSQAVDRELASGLSVLNTLARSPQLQSGDLAGFYAYAVAVNRQSKTMAIGLSDSGGHRLDPELAAELSMTAGNCTSAW